MVLALAIISANFLLVSGPTSRIISSSATSSIFFNVAAVSLENSFATTTSTGIGISAPRCLAFSISCLAFSTKSASYNDLPTLKPAATINVFAIPPPTIS